EAERRAQLRYPRLRAEAIGYLNVRDETEWTEREAVRLEACLQAAREGLGGVDFRVDPYDVTADPDLWGTAYRWAERAAAVGLGVTVHVGEFGTASVAAALQTPGLRRIGHGT